MLHHSTGKRCMIELSDEAKKERMRPDDHARDYACGHPARQSTIDRYRLTRLSYSKDIFRKRGRAGNRKNGPLERVWVGFGFAL
jgi:hypothetical protein